MEETITKESIEENFGINKYTCSEKTKRPSKVKINQETLDKRNATQKKVYITLDNINEIFSNNDKFPVSYDYIFNYIQGKVTKYYNGWSYDRKKDISYDCINYLFSVLKRKLLGLKNDNKNPILFFQLSQFFRYVDLLVFSVTYYARKDELKYVQEQDKFNNDDILRGLQNLDTIDDLDYMERLDIIDDFGEFVDKETLDDSNYLKEDIVDNNSDKIKLCIENNKKLDNQEKRVLLKAYKNCYSDFGMGKFTKKDTEVLNILKLRMDYEPNLLDGLEDILNGKR